MKKYSAQDLEDRLTKFPSVKLTSLPTPLYPLENLSLELGGPAILIKRDDLTGLAFGGNKSRKLEFIIADALQKGADTLITWASLQSNWCLQLAVAARKFGLRPILVLFKTYDLPFSYDGNLLLDFLVEAEIKVSETEEKGKSVSQEKAFRLIEEIAEEEKKKGREPYAVSVGGSATGGDMDKPLGALAYLKAMVEMEKQLREMKTSLSHIIIASGSGSTQAGLLVGAKAFGLETKVTGICVSDSKEEFGPQVKDIAMKLIKSLQIEVEIEDRDVILFDQYLGQGYGVVNEEVAEIIRLVLKKEGLVLDPVYTSKAMIGLVDLIRRGYFSGQDRVLFVHTGGTPALFAFKDRVIEKLG
jgi:D-cysteine desulfhydrase family pyridoxal phosphate-dependent enzyme